MYTWTLKLAYVVPGSAPQVCPREYLARPEAVCLPQTKNNVLRDKNTTRSSLEVSSFFGPDCSSTAFIDESVPIVTTGN